MEQRRLEALRRREELHDIISEDIEEAAMTGGTHMTNQLLRTYYGCQVRQKVYSYVVVIPGVLSFYLNPPVTEMYG